MANQIGAGNFSEEVMAVASLMHPQAMQTLVRNQMLLIQVIEEGLQTQSGEKAIALKPNQLEAALLQLAPHVINLQEQVEGVTVESLIRAIQKYEGEDQGMFEVQGDESSSDSFFGLLEQVALIQIGHSQITASWAQIDQTQCNPMFKAVLDWQAAEIRTMWQSLLNKYIAAADGYASEKRDSTLRYLWEGWVFTNSIQSATALLFDIQTLVPHFLVIT